MMFDFILVDDVEECVDVFWVVVLVFQVVCVFLYVQVEDGGVVFYQWVVLVVGVFDYDFFVWGYVQLCLVVVEMGQCCFGEGVFEFVEIVQVFVDGFGYVVYWVVVSIWSYYGLEQ